MLIYYRLPGLLADLALILYGLFNLALYKLIPVTLTLPAITGFILSTGMAVDANILVFERMKEELRAGRSLGSAIEAGFSRAWTSIRDSNISTLITCAILFYFGSTFGAGAVQGLCHHPGPGCGHQHVYRHHRDPDLYAADLRLAGRKARRTTSSCWASSQDR